MTPIPPPIRTKPGNPPRPDSTKACGHPLDGIRGLRSNLVPLIIRQIVFTRDPGPERREGLLGRRSLLVGSRRRLVVGVGRVAAGAAPPRDRVLRPLGVGLVSLGG